MTIPPPPPGNHAPQPGEYYNNAYGQYTPKSNRPGTLTAFMVLEWITFAYCIFAFCGGTVSLLAITVLNRYSYYDPSALTSISSIISLLFNLGIGALACTSAVGILQNRKYGITAGLADVGLTGMSILFGIGVAIIQYTGMAAIYTHDIYSAGTSGGFLIGTLAITSLQIGWVVTKAILIRHPSTLRAAATYR